MISKMGYELTETAQNFNIDYLAKRMRQSGIPVVRTSEKFAEEKFDLPTGQSAELAFVRQYLRAWRSNKPTFGRL